jgi:2-phospho-L-lactate guanylyltransferase
MRTSVLLPIKHPLRAKLRLADVLSPGERSHLVWAMFEDVSSALRQITQRVALVTAYEPAATRARAYGWTVFVETQQISESHSVDAASLELRQLGFEAVLRLPADIPLIEPRDVAQIHNALEGNRAAVAVPSRDGTGTNAILRAPPDLFASHFGPDSLRLHSEEARRVSAAFSVVRNDRVGLDLDEPGDLDTFMQLSSDTHTHDLLVKIGWGERMARRAGEHLHSRG